MPGRRDRTAGHHAHEPRIGGGGDQPRQPLMTGDCPVAVFTMV